MRRRSTWRQWLFSRCGWSVIASLVAVSVLSAVGSPVAFAQEEPVPAVQIIHGSPSLGAVDLYVDGQLLFLSLTFAAVSNPIALPAGSRTVSVMPAGQSPDEALLETVVALESGTAADLVLLGPADNLTVGVYPVDLSPLPPGLTRFGVVLGSTDTGPVDIAMTGGDLLFPTLEYVAATEFADITAGTYDFEVRYGGTDAVALALPDTVLEEGQVYRLFVVGEAAAGQLQSLLVTRAAAAVVVDGHPAWIQAGDCTELGTAQAVAELTVVATSPFADPVGHPAAAQARTSFTTIEVAFDVLTETAHAVVVAESEELRTNVLSCGEVGGTPTNNGSLVIGLRQVAASGVAGVAVLSPNVLDPTITDVSVFVADGLHPDGRDQAPAAEVSVVPLAPAAQDTATPRAATPNGAPVVGPLVWQ